MNVKLQRIADDIWERLLILEIELRSRSIERRMEAFEDVGSIVACVDLFRLEVEAQRPPPAGLGKLLQRLDRKVSTIKRSAPYRIVEWLNSANLSWYVRQSSPAPAMVC
jgi:hypothetical protein